MRSDAEPSTFDLLIESLGMIWNPGLEALKLKQAFDIQSLAAFRLPQYERGVRFTMSSFPLGSVDSPFYSMTNDYCHQQRQPFTAQGLHGRS